MTWDSRCSLLRLPKVLPVCLAASTNHCSGGLHSLCSTLGLFSPQLAAYGGDTSQHVTTLISTPIPLQYLAHPTTFPRSLCLLLIDVDICVRPTTHRPSRHNATPYANSRWLHQRATTLQGTQRDTIMRARYGMVPAYHLRRVMRKVWISVALWS